uniref:Odorant receptor n=1 Tax=Aphidius gifuensis TaxID=684658 RepID=A0A3Q9ELR4_APHGI|nr:odorant receptor [Aphidius gifuensis]
MNTLDIEALFSVNKKILKLVGLYPIMLKKYFTCLFFMLLIVIPEIHQIYINQNNLKTILETASVLLTIILAILKSVIWLLKKDTINLIDFLFTVYWKIAISVDGSNDIYQYARSARRITIGYCILICNALLVFFGIPLMSYAVNRSNDNQNSTIKFNLPFVASYPKIFYESPIFEMIYLSQLLATSTCGIIILGTDTLIATAIFHTCGHFVILKKNLEKLVISPIKNIDNSKKIDKEFNLIIKHHQTIIRFSQRIENIFSPMMLVQVIASSIIICLVGFQVNSTFSEGDGLAEYLSYLLMALFQLLIFCWPGDELINKSKMISQAAYSTNWYFASDNVKKKIRFMVFRGQKPCFLSAGKFSYLNLEYFSTILSTSVSYFTLLRKTQ